jgi:hypothetical protein
LLLIVLLLLLLLALRHAGLVPGVRCPLTAGTT